jgi:hypothetical protein
MRSPFAHRWLTLGLLAAAGASLAGCAALANPHADNTVVVTQLNLASCQSPAAPPGSEYSGEQAVDRTQPGDMVVQLNNPHLTKCVASYPTTIDVYDGRVNDANARLLKKLSFTVRNSC